MKHINVSAFLKFGCFSFKGIAGVVVFSVLAVMSVCELRCATIVNQRMGSIDMNRIIDENPEAKAIKDELSAGVEIRRNSANTYREQITKSTQEIKDMEEQLRRYKESIIAKPEPAATASGSASPYQTAPDTGAPVAVSSPVAISPAPVPIVVSSPTFTAQDIEDKKALLQKQETDLTDYVIETEQQAKDINKKARRNLLGKIYDSIKEVAEEEGVTVVLDNSSMIYDDGVVDITDKVIKRMKSK
jgi:Skp family chaperone for outer membrane proteins